MASIARRPIFDAALQVHAADATFPSQILVSIWRAREMTLLNVGGMILGDYLTKARNVVALGQ